MILADFALSARGGLLVASQWRQLRVGEHRVISSEMNPVTPVASGRILKNDAKRVVACQPHREFASSTRLCGSSARESCSVKETCAFISCLFMCNTQFTM